MSKVMVFGVFDGIHDGHRSLFAQALAYGDHLVVAVAVDDTVRTLKNHAPERSLEERLALVGAEAGVREAVPGDKDLGSWGVVRAYQPEVIALGYDQKEMAKNLFLHAKEFSWNPHIVMLAPYKPETHHSSFLRNPKNTGSTR